jgi:hypothetical protein
MHSSRSQSLTNQTVDVACLDDSQRHAKQSKAKQRKGKERREMEYQWYALLFCHVSRTTTGLRRFFSPSPSSSFFSVLVFLSQSIGSHRIAVFWAKTGFSRRFMSSFQLASHSLCSIQRLSTSTDTSHFTDHTIISNELFVKKQINV